MMQVFSHPIYSIDSLSWLWLMNPKTDRGFIPKKVEGHLIVFPEDGKTIASKLKRFPLLIISKFSGTTIQGEKFVTVNRLHSQINSALYQQGQFLKIHSLDLEGGRFPVHFMLNKDFSILRSSHTNKDNWTKWGGEVEHFSSKQTKLVWRARPIRKMDSFNLVNKNNKDSFVKMTFNKILPNGKHEYQSEIVPATNKLIKFIVTPESSGFLLADSNLDKRMLAFNQVETEVLQYE